MQQTLAPQLLVFLGLVTVCLSQYYTQEPSQGQYRQPSPAPSDHYHNEEPYEPKRPPPPQIIMHKQAQSHDGGFKYAFAAENGLAQGESIAPDGTRTGGYTYVDPHGKKISVKYTAGKDGFRILEGDHIPKAPAPVAAAAPAYSPPQPQPSYVSYQQANAGGAGADDGQYRPERYERVQQPSAPAQVVSGYAQPRPTPYYQPKYAAPRAEAVNAIDGKEPEYFDEPGKPYSFGKGYSFEFGG